MLTSTIPASASLYGIAAPVQRGAARTFSGNRLPVHLFLDFSNTAISASQVGLERGDGLFNSRRVRLHAGNFRAFVERDRFWADGYAAAALPDPRSPISACFERVGIRFAACERGHISGSEQGVDQMIQCEMYPLLDDDVPRGTVVLASGDGNGYEAGRGFLKPLELLRKEGFSVEVMSWRHSFNPRLRDWACEYGRAIELDEFYLNLTFVPGYRHATETGPMFKKMSRLGIC